MQAAFSIRQLRYWFRARDTIVFGASGAANAIRGALGWNLRQDAGTYVRLFKPVQSGLGPSGFADTPRPFVLRASHLDDRRLEPGETFSFDVHLFETEDRADEAVRSLSAAFERMAEVTALESTHRQIDLVSFPPGFQRVRVEFVTPTELKRAGELAARPEFPILFARVRDRVATLRALYGPGAPEVDFVRFNDRAEHILMETCELQRVHRMRHSSRTGQTHGIGGFTGSAIYSGDLGEFWPWLEAAEWTGVGRQTVWGKGQIRLTKL